MEHEPAQRIAFPKIPACAQRFADDDLRDVVLTRNAQQCLSDITARRRNHFRARADARARDNE